MIYYPDLKKCRNVANELLLAQKRLPLQFDVEKLNYGDKHIIFDSLQTFAEVTDMPLSILLHDKQSPLRDGVTIHHTKKDVHIVLHNAEIQMHERLRWTQAHEVGHIMLGHVEDGHTEEIEANAFAAQLLMPWFTIRMMSNFRKPSAEHIARTFGVSITAANLRITDVQRIADRPTEMDRKIYDRQKKFILPEKREPMPVEILDRIIYASNR